MKSIYSNPDCLEHASTAPTTPTSSAVTSTRPATRSRSSTRPFSAGNKKIIIDDLQNSKIGPKLKKGNT